MALTVSIASNSRMIIEAIKSLSVAYGSPLNTQSLPLYDDGLEDPSHPTLPWARLVAIDTGEITGNTGCANDGSTAPLVVTVNVTAPVAATEQDYFALDKAIDAVVSALRQGLSIAPASGQTQRIHFHSVRGGIDPQPSQTINLRTGFVIALADVDRAIDG